VDIKCINVRGIWTPLNRSVPGVTRLVALVLTLRTLSSSASKTASPVPIVDKVVEEDRHMLLANELESRTLPDGTTQALSPTARVAFAIFEDLCLLGNGEHPQFLQLEYLHKTFTLELIKSVVLTKLPRTLRKMSLLPFTHPRPVYQQLSSNHSHVHSIPSS
jgi:Guanine nucleotide exchange factor in Golgi transport N-terminal